MAGDRFSLDCDSSNLVGWESPAGMTETLACENIQFLTGHILACCCVWKKALKPTATIGLLEKLRHWHFKSSGVTEQICHNESK